LFAVSDAGGQWHHTGDGVPFSSHAFVQSRVGCRRALAPLRGWSSLLFRSLRSTLPAIVAPRGVSPDKPAVGVDKPSGENVAPIKHLDAPAWAVLEFLNDLDRRKIVCFARVLQYD
jgi:hypothetical protein